MEKISYVPQNKIERLKDDIRALPVKVVSPEYAYFPLLTSTDATLCAQNLTKDDLLIFYNVCKDFYKNILDPNRIKYEIMEKYFCCSLTAYMWLAEMFLEAQKLLLTDHDDIAEIAVPYDDSIVGSTLKKKQIRATAPYKVIERDNDGYWAYPTRSSKDTTFLQRNRIFYISQMYEASDFYVGYPSWYRLSKATVFEQYCPQIGKRVKIVYKDNEYLYYVCGASDNWQRIKGVPIEVDWVITALLFRK